MGASAKSAALMLDTRSQPVGERLGRDTSGSLYDLDGQLGSHVLGTDVERPCYKRVVARLSQAGRLVRAMPLNDHVRIPNDRIGHRPQIARFDVNEVQVVEPLHPIGPGLHGALPAETGCKRHLSRLR